MDNDRKGRVKEAALGLAAKGDYASAKANFLSDCRRIPFPGMEVIIMACPREFEEFKARVEMVLM